MGRPTWRTRICPKKKCYGDFERIYVRRENKMIGIGRKCRTCGHIVLD